MKSWFEAKLHVDVVARSMSSDRMNPTEKACAIVLRLKNDKPEVLAFVHPSAGKQFVKGTIEAGESPLQAAIRELREESGLQPDMPLISIGTLPIGDSHQRWHFFKCMSLGLPENWSHQTEDDFGHKFAFFWHPLRKPLDQDWHPNFHEAFAFFAPLCLAE